MCNFNEGGACSYNEWERTDWATPECTGEYWPSIDWEHSEYPITNYTCCRNVCDGGDLVRTAALSLTAPFSYALENRDDDVDVYMVLAPLLTGGIAYELDGARVVVPEAV